MLDPKEINHIMAAERRAMRNRIGLGIPVIAIFAFISWLRLVRWESGNPETNAWTVGALAVVGITIVVWLNRRWVSRIQSELDKGEVVQVQDEVRTADGTQIRLSNQRLRVARNLSSKANGLKRGDYVDLDYLPKMRLIIRLRKLTT